MAGNGYRAAQEKLVEVTLSIRVVARLKIWQQKLVHMAYPSALPVIAHFRNEKKQDASPDTALSEKSESTIYKLYKKSADFSIDANFTKYPSDIQELEIELALIIPSDQVLISFDHAGFNDSKKRAEEFSLNDWYMEDFYSTSRLTTSLRPHLGVGPAL